jgi:hypothetical protein
VVWSPSWEQWSLNFRGDFANSLFILQEQILWQLAESGRVWCAIYVKTSGPYVTSVFSVIRCLISGASVWYTSFSHLCYVKDGQFRVTHLREFNVSWGVRNVLLLRADLSWITEWSSTCDVTRNEWRPFYALPPCVFKPYDHGKKLTV